MYTFIKSTLSVTGISALLGGSYFMLYPVLNPKLGGLDRNDILKQSQNSTNFDRCMLSQPRSEQIKRLRQSLNNKEQKQKEQFDIVVIGGGATGAGIALDAATRGLKVALFERKDFASGTSSRSTKLAHGGVRYLQKAILELDRSELAFVREGLQQRKHFFQVAPHLAKPQPILAPCYSVWQAIKLFVGLRLYDILSGNQYSMGHSSWVGKQETIKNIPNLKQEGLKGAMLYYDGQFNDARMNLSLITTASSLGAVTLNHFKVKDLIKKQDESGKQVCSGVVVEDMLADSNGERIQYEIYSKIVINATGPSTYSIRRMDNIESKDIMSCSQGTHLTLPKTFTEGDYGVLFPETSDGRVLFMLPWEGQTIVGTTDNKVDQIKTPYTTAPMDDEIEFILQNINRYYDKPIQKEMIQSAWAGIRPLVQGDSQNNQIGTKQQSRDYLIDVSSSNLITIAGGKWTCFNKMAQDSVDRAIQIGQLSPKCQSKSESTLLIGSQFYDKEQDLNLQKSIITAEEKSHLIHFYGDRAERICEIIKKYPEMRERIVKEFPFLKAEVVYQMEDEFAEKPYDIICFRTNLMFLNRDAAFQALPIVVDIMAKHKGWDLQYKIVQLQESFHYIKKATK